jgi:membrane protease YdiL (CAAX protease family)
MDSLSPEQPPVTVTPAPHRRRVWKFWGTLLWGLLIFVAMIVGQLATLVYLGLRQGGPLLEAIVALGDNGLAVALSVVTGFPALLAALWLAIRFTATPFGDYIALRRPAWKPVLLGAIGLAVIAAAWEVMSRATGRESAPDFMVNALKSAQADGVVWLMLIAFCVAAPVTEELFARGFLYRGWSETALRPAGAILLSSALWTAVHVQYGWYFLAEVFAIGVWLGYLRYRFQSIWITIIVHGLNNFAAFVQTVWLAGQS